MKQMGHLKYKTTPVRPEDQEEYEANRLKAIEASTGCACLKPSGNMFPCPKAIGSFCIDCSPIQQEVCDSVVKEYREEK